MTLTQEQMQIIKIAKEGKHQLIKVAAVAGSGKTATLLQLANELNPQNALYTAFNKAIVTESATKFNSNVECRTLHSIAHKYIIANQKNPRQIDSFTYSCIKESIPFEDKIAVKKALESFFNSAELSTKFFTDNYEPIVASTALLYLEKMVNNEIPVTFGFLIKFFLLELSNGLKVEPYDLLMLDEAGDVTAVTLAIFKLLPAKLKVMVGDPLQNIYSFMDTVNGFIELYNEGILCRLSTTFRVKAPIAREIETYLKKVFSEDIIFTGNPNKETSIKTHAYIARTNAGLINRIMKLNAIGADYKMIRDPKDIFSLPIALICMKPSHPPYKKEHLWIYNELRRYNSDASLRTRYVSFFKYLRACFSDDVPLKQALHLITKYTPSKIFETYKQAQDIYKKRASSTTYTLATAHSCKGLTYDSVYIEDDMNTVIADILKETTAGNFSDTQLEELRLGYVAVTRCRIRLHNAEFLNITGKLDYGEYNHETD